MGVTPEGRTQDLVLGGGGQSPQESPPGGPLMHKVFAASQAFE